MKLSLISRGKELKATPLNGANFPHCFLLECSACSLSVAAAWSSDTAVTLLKCSPMTCHIRDHCSRIRLMLQYDISTIFCRLNIRGWWGEASSSIDTAQSQRTKSTTGRRQKRKGSLVSDSHTTTRGTRGSYKSQLHTYCISIQSSRAGKNSREEIQISQVLRKGRQKILTVKTDQKSPHPEANK